MFNSELQRIKKNIRKHFEYLFKSGFHIFSANMRKEHMGYWEVVLHSEKLFLQIYNDRGEIMMSMGPSRSLNDNWYGLGVLVYYVTKGERFIGNYQGDLMDIEAQLERLSNILREYIDEITDVVAFNYEQNKQKLDETVEKVLEVSRQKYSESRSVDELLKYVPRRKSLK